MLVTLISLGVWQLQRRQWKQALIAQLRPRNACRCSSPAIYFRAMNGEASVQYRRAELPCSPGKVLPYDLKGGSSDGGVSGYIVLVSCRPNNRPPDIVAVAGWTRRPDAARCRSLSTPCFAASSSNSPMAKPKAGRSSC